MKRKAKSELWREFRNRNETDSTFRQESTPFNRSEVRRRPSTLPAQDGDLFPNARRLKLPLRSRRGSQFRSLRKNFSPGGNLTNPASHPFGKRLTRHSQCTRMDDDGKTTRRTKAATCLISIRRRRDATARKRLNP